MSLPVLVAADEGPEGVRVPPQASVNEAAVVGIHESLPLLDGGGGPPVPGSGARVRLKAFGGSFGVVPFLDGGTLTTDAMPDFGKWQLGAGIGLRYYSSFGPIRVDVGTPLNRQANDARVAVVVSLGQAF